MNLSKGRFSDLNQKEKLQQEVNSYFKKYIDDIFFGEELKLIEKRLLSMESSIAVVGQFSVGKSALLNALLGQEILATRKIESTKILTRIRHCTSTEDAKVVLTLKDGQKNTLPLTNVSDLQKYTTFQGEEITDFIQYVDVYWPVQFLNKELILIDTPGSNSLTTSAFQTTKEQLKSSSAIIYLFMGTKGLDARDYEIIEEYATHKKKIFLVGTHLDQLMKEQWLEVQEEVKKKIIQINAIKDIEIIGVSSSEALSGKQQQNEQLLQQSNMLALEKILHTYMATKEYENAEIRSIEHDFLKLLNEITSFEQQQLQTKEAAEADRLKRLERLKAITESEYSEVEQYGLELLKRRNNLVNQLNDEYKSKLLFQDNDILKEVRQQFKQFQLYIRQEMTKLPKMEILKKAYVQHLNEIEKIYKKWDENLELFGQKFVKAIEQQVQQQDTQFINMLKQLETKVALSWDEFDLILKKIQLKPLNFSADFKDFEQYDAKIAIVDQKYNQYKSQLRNKEQDLQKLSSEKDREERSIRSSKKQEQNGLGKKPEPRAMYQTKGILFWKRDEFIGYDYSAQERWDHQMSEIHSKYKDKLRKIEQSYASEHNNEIQQKKKIEEQMEELEDAEQDYSLELLGALYITVSNQSEIVKKLHSGRVNNIKSEWETLASEQEERYYEHIQTIEERYKKFVQQSKEQAITRLKVL